MKRKEMIPQEPKGDVSMNNHRDDDGHDPEDDSDQDYFSRQDKKKKNLSMEGMQLHFLPYQ